MSVSDRAIAISNKKRHEELCRAISKDLPAFIRVGAYLVELKGLEVYKETHKTFEAFIFDQFGFERAQAYRLIDAATVSANLSPIGDISVLPKTESQYREVAKAPPEKQAEVVKKVAEIAAEQNRKPTAKDYKQVVGEIVFDKPKPKSKPIPKPKIKVKLAKPTDPPLTKDEQLQLERKKAKAYAEYLVRSIDDMQRSVRSPMHPTLIGLCDQIVKGLEQW